MFRLVLTVLVGVPLLLHGQRPPVVRDSVPLVDLSRAAAIMEPGQAPPPGRFTSGRYRDEAIHFSFDMKQDRQAWDFHQMASLELAAPADFSTFGGLRLLVETDQPREDVSVSLWLREQDGSWYYLKSAVSLADVRNPAEVSFEDFLPATGLAPGSGRDEDFVLDLRSVTHFAIGVIEPDGVGLVEFALRHLEVVSRKEIGPRLARATVTGKTFSINGRETLPGLWPRMEVARVDRAATNGPVTDSVSVCAGHDLAAAAAAARGEKLEGFNHTVPESGTAVRGSGDRVEGEGYRQLTLELRDAMACALFSPDRVRTRTHRAGGDLQAQQVARELIRGLEGRLVETRCDDPGVWVVSSLSGEPGTPAKLVTMLFNDHRVTRDVALEIRAPEGTRLGEGEVEWVYVDPADQSLSRRSRPVSKPDLPSQSVAIQVAPKSVWKVSLVLEGEPGPGAVLERRQFFSPALNLRVGRIKPARVEVPLERGWVETAERAWLRLVVREVVEGEGRVLVGAQEQVIPEALTGVGMSGIVTVPVDVQGLTEQMELVFRVGEGAFDGYWVEAVSVVVER